MYRYVEFNTYDIKIVEQHTPAKTCVTKNILFLTNLDILICNKGGISPKQRLFQHVIWSLAMYRTVLLWMSTAECMLSLISKSNSSFVYFVLYRLFCSILPNVLLQLAQFKSQETRSDCSQNAPETV